MDEFKKELKAVNPFKIDIGAVYNVKPKDHKSFKSSSFTAMEREVVFDIDMTDYDEVRLVEGIYHFRCYGALPTFRRNFSVGLESGLGSF